MKKLIKIFYDYTKWEVLETYVNSGTCYCVQVRMNNKTGFKHFKVNKITPRFGWCIIDFKVEKINELTTQSNSNN